MMEGSTSVTVEQWGDIPVEITKKSTQQGRWKGKKTTQIFLFVFIFDEIYRYSEW